MDALQGLLACRDLGTAQALVPVTAPVWAASPSGRLVGNYYSAGMSPLLEFFFGLGA